MDPVEILQIHGHYNENFALKFEVTWKEGWCNEKFRSFQPGDWFLANNLQTNLEGYIQERILKPFQAKYPTGFGLEKNSRKEEKGRRCRRGTSNYDVDNILGVRFLPASSKYLVEWGAPYENQKSFITASLLECPGKLYKFDCFSKKFAQLALVGCKKSAEFSNPRSDASSSTSEDSDSDSSMVSSITTPKVKKPVKDTHSPNTLDFNFSLLGMVSVSKPNDREIEDWANNDGQVQTPGSISSCSSDIQETSNLTQVRQAVPTDCTASKIGKRVKINVEQPVISDLQINGEAIEKEVQTFDSTQDRTQLGTSLSTSQIIYPKNVFDQVNFFKSPQVLNLDTPIEINPPIASTSHAAGIKCCNMQEKRIVIKEILKDLYSATDGNPPQVQLDGPSSSYRIEIPEQYAQINKVVGTSTVEESNCGDRVNKKQSSQIIEIETCIQKGPEAGPSTAKIWQKTDSNITDSKIIQDKQIVFESTLKDLYRATGESPTQLQLARANSPSTNGKFLNLLEALNLTPVKSGQKPTEIGVVTTRNVNVNLGKIKVKGNNESSKDIKGEEKNPPVKFFQQWKTFFNNLKK